ncbi:hypothetical protein D9M69_491770 [compost metagenome]
MAGMVPPVAGHRRQRPCGRCRHSRTGRAGRREDRPGAAGRYPEALHERLRGPVAGHGRGQSRGRGAAARPALCRRGVAQQCSLPLCRSVLPAQRTRHDRAGGRRRGRRQDAPAHPLCDLAMGRCDVAGQLPGHQPRSAAAADRIGRRIAARRRAQHARRPDARQDLADRRDRVRGRPQRRRDRRCGGL